MISTSFIIGTGFIKCIPITFSGRFVTEAILVMEIEEVLVAKIQFSGAKSSICLKIFIFRSRFSVAASTINSAFFAASSNAKKVVMFPKVSAFCSSVRFPFAMIRSRLLVMVFRPLSNASWETSTRLTLNPVCAKVCAMPFPIVPAPITTMFFINLV
ncbi:hypothetical protein SDC9_137311 [bioreactor metagenome]|uniref:Uncharacterized protein n=1 Tax=bioreactor metagenome TaxID=1076179 RepID=A0A645DL68_9ZZZZ